MISHRWLALLLTTVSLSCASGDESSEGSASDNFDSAEGNPTHPTHSSMAEIAIETLRAEAPEVATFERQIVDGANLELHDLPSKTDEALRIEIGGNNWAADHPEILWQKARASYQAGDKAAAYRLVGVLLHYVQDMGSPAHAFHVIHQSSPRNWDRFEMLAFFKFQADMKAPPLVDPSLASPVDYIEWSAKVAREHFSVAYPGRTYDRLFFPQTNDEMTEHDWAFMRRREADCVWATTYALKTAAKALAKTR